MASFLQDTDRHLPRHELGSFLLSPGLSSGLGDQTTQQTTGMQSDRMAQHYGLNFDTTEMGKGTALTSFLQIYGPTSLAGATLRNSHASPSPAPFALPNAHSLQPPDTYTYTDYITSAPTDAKQPTMTARATPPPKAAKSVPPHKKHETDIASIREKLGDFGIKVSDAKNVSTASHATKTDAPPPDDAHKLVFRGRRGARGAHRGAGPSPQPKAARWPGKKDYAKLDYKQPSADNDGWGWGPEWNDSTTEQRSWGAKKQTESPGTSIDSARADGGCGNIKRRAVEGDPTNRLANFDGTLAPAPLDWDSRPAFREQQSGDQVQRWLDNAETAISSVLNRVISLDARHEMGDIIPRYWIPVTVGRLNPGTFWEEHINSESPMPLDEEDLHGAQPWWDLLPQHRNFLDNVTHPTIAGIDPDETLEERLTREADQGGINHEENRARLALAKQQAEKEKQTRQDAKKKRLMSRNVNRDRQQPDARLRIGLPKMIIRSARREDLEAVRQIYNYYVRNTCAVQETEDLTEKDILELFNDSKKSKFPFLVAFERGEVIKPRKNKKNREAEDIILPDTILGFVHADEYCNDPKSMFRFTAEIKVFTSQDHYQQGVASCLVDKALAMLDPDYLERGGYNVQGEELEGVEPRRLIKNVTIQYLFEKPEKLNWMTRWLGEIFGFKHVGQMNGIGTKLGRPVSFALFQRSTGAQLDHANPPAAD